MSRDTVKSDEIADDVYCQFVQSMFVNGHILLIGGLCYCVIALVVYLQTHILAFLVFAALLPLVNGWRYLGIQAFHRKVGAIKSVAEAKEWEYNYIIRGSAQGLTVGAFCFASIYSYPSAYAEVASLSMAVGSLITVATRNFGSPRMVVILSGTFIGPAAAAFLLRGDLAYAILGLMIVPMSVITISSADYVRRVLFSAIVGEKRTNQIAQRFDRALNTMPQGLLMFDRAGKVIVANVEASELTGLRAPATLLGRSMASLARRAVASGLMAKENCDDTVRQLMRALRDGSDRKMIVALLDGRSFEITTREGDNDLGVVMFEDVTQRVRASERISIMARFDGLTELPNRDHFQELVTERLKHGDPSRLCSLAIFDLDDFKGINDTLGHPFGDKLIHVIGRRLGDFASADLITGRWGGDEFVVYCDDIQEPELPLLLDKFRGAMVKPMEISGHRTRVEVSGGAAMMRAGEATIDKMTIRADLALNHSKSRSRNDWSLFEESMEQTFRMREILKADLRTAISEQSLSIVYQPIVRLDTMKIATCEALCRWRHPELGQISPAVFIPLAEETGLISEITSFVLERACADASRWPSQIGVSVNLSAKDLADAGVVLKVASILERTGLSPERLEVEMTETSLLDDKSAARTHAEEIRRLGVTIALDDFGTGYSSLSYIHRLPLDKIKIDRSFVLDMVANDRSRQLIKSIVQLSHSLGIAVTVEGVETFEQLRLLAGEVHPDMVQGFLFGSALTATGIETMSLAAWRFAGDPAKLVKRRRRTATK